MSAKKPSSAVLQARKALKEKIKNDWEYRPEASAAPQINDSSIGQTGAIALELPATAPADTISLEDVAEWRERAYATSDGSTDTDDGRQAGRLAKMNGHINGIGDKYHSELDSGPKTSSGSRAKISSNDQNRRRHQKHGEELEWNQGLRFFEARRNAWCSARNMPAQFRHDSADPHEKQRDASASLQPQTGAANPLPTNHATTILPVAPPILPDTDPARVGITPAVYPLLYEHVVESNRAPAVPVNLSIMIPALVWGWTEDGDWPYAGQREPTAYEAKLIADQDARRERGKAHGVAAREARKARGRAYGAPDKEGERAKRSVRGSVGGFLSDIIHGSPKKEQSPRPQTPLSRIISGSPKQGQREPSQPGGGDDPSSPLTTKSRKRSSLSGSPSTVIPSTSKKEQRAPPQMRRAEGNDEAPQGLETRTSGIGSPTKIQEAVDGNANGLGLSGGGGLVEQEPSKQGKVGELRRKVSKVLFRH